MRKQYVRKILAISLTIIMVLSLYGCRALGRTIGSLIKGKGGEASQELIETVEKADSSEEVIAEDDRVFWVEAKGRNTMTFYFKDEKVNQLEENDWISIDFYSNDTQILWYNLTSINENVAIIDDVYTNIAAQYAPDNRYPITPEGNYPNDTISFTVYDLNIVELFNQCDRIEFTLYVKDEYQFLEYDDPQMIASLVDYIDTNRGARLAFEGDNVFIQFYGKEFLEDARAYHEDYGSSLQLKIGTTDYYDLGDHSISMNPTFLLGASLDSGEYKYAGEHGYDEYPRVLWCDEDEEQISVWFHAPGYKNTIDTNSEYVIPMFTPGDPYDFIGEIGRVSDIICDYVSYEDLIPEIPSEFLVNVISADDEYFKPMTPNYMLLRYDYPAAPITTDFRWAMINRLGPSYGYGGWDIRYAPVTVLKLTSYSPNGSLVQSRAKVIYSNETDAVHGNVHCHTVLRDAIGTTYGTEADFQDWIYEEFTNINDFLAHEGNVVYFKSCEVDASYSSYIGNEFDDTMHKKFDYLRSTLPANKVEKGTFPYTYDSYGNADRYEDTCNYTAYITFDLQKFQNN